jgi:hypothetical protein
MTNPISREDYISGLRALAVLLEQHPELELPYQGSGKGLEIIPVGRDGQREQLAAWARVLADKTEDPDKFGGLFVLRGQIGGLRVDVLCNRAYIEGVEWQHPVNEWSPLPIPGDVWVGRCGAPWFAVDTGNNDPELVLVDNSGERWSNLDEVWDQFGPMRRAFPAGGAR